MLKLVDDTGKIIGILLDNGDTIMVPSMTDEQKKQYNIPEDAQYKPFITNNKSHDNFDNHYIRGRK